MFNFERVSNRYAAFRLHTNMSGPIWSLKYQIRKQIAHNSLSSGKRFQDFLSSKQWLICFNCLQQFFHNTTKYFQWHFSKIDFFLGSNGRYICLWLNVQITPQFPFQKQNIARIIWNHPLCQGPGLLLLMHPKEYTMLLPSIQWFMLTAGIKDGHQKLAFGATKASV